ncbi:MAG: MmcQ/YjbR family DNA-binding protein [Dehalococcoidia bacterium]|nr:MmcQ/YjbR family DNA-binding protein [Dehalococcoidia bacterium]
MDPAREAALQAWLAERRERQQHDPSLARLRALCLALPEVTERLSHGEPCWFIQGKRTFAGYSDRHHNDRLGFVCAGQPGAQQALLAIDPERFFAPPYVGGRGWLGVYLDVPGVDWDDVANLVREAYLQLAPRRLAAALVGDAAARTR